MDLERTLLGAVLVVVLAFLAAPGAWAPSPPPEPPSGTPETCANVSSGYQPRPTSAEEHQGYWLAGADGGVFFYDDPYEGGQQDNHLAAPIDGIAPDSQYGYWLVARDGGVFASACVGFYGSAARMHLAAPVVGIASTPDANGYWLVGADGGVFNFGDARFFGSGATGHLPSPVVGMATTPDGGGYWLLARDGSVYTYGDALYFGGGCIAPAGGTTAGGLPCPAIMNAPAVGISATPDGHGYWVASSDGGVFSFGDASFFGAAAGLHLAAPIVGIQSVPPTPSCQTPPPGPGPQGYWLTGGDGGVFSFGDARFYGSAAGVALNAPVVGIASGLPPSPQCSG